jgi:2,4-dienoyl-CoA reductase-like NADH-dependent reductase (Old Yellow Enzyme family)
MVAMAAAPIPFEPFTLGPLTLPNRFVRAACGERMADREGRVGHDLLAYVDVLARGGAGLIILGHGYVRRDGRLTDNETGLDRDDQIPRLKLIAQQIQRRGARACLQVSHGGRQCRPVVIETTPLAPSPIEVIKTGVVPRELNVEEILELVAAFVRAATRVREAGFDAVQVHAAHGYLISQFLSPATNRREDEWGGDPVRRRRFLLEVVHGIRGAVGPDYPLLLKMNLDDCIPGGISLEEALAAAAAAREAGIDALEVSGGMVDSAKGAARKDIQPGRQEAYFRPLARAARAALDLPLILVGGIKSPATVSDLVASGDVDLVALGRPLIREPRLPLDWLDGRQTPADCRSCNRCALYKDRPLRCESLAQEQERIAEAGAGGPAVS